MSCIEIINQKDVTDPEELAEKLQQETFDVNLPSGAQLTQHKEKAYENLYKTGKSFDELEEKKVDELLEKGIHFGFDFKLHPEGIKKMKNVGNTIQSNTLVIQHNCIMYTYAYALSAAIDDEKQGLLCQFVLFPISFTYRHPTGATKGGVAAKLNQKAPELQDVTLKIGEVKETIDLCPEMDGTYKCKTLITLDSLKNITANGVATLRVEMTVDEYYFRLDEYIELSPRVAPIAQNSQDILEKILKGEKTPKSDWVITVGEGSPRDYHVHGPVLSNSSFVFKAALTSHMSIGNDILSMVSHENRFILQKLKAEDMRTFLTFIYQKRFHLPTYESVSRIGIVLSHFFRDDMDQFFEYWQSSLINNMLKLDKKDSIKTITECVKSLIFVHSAPRGALIIAYNVGICVGADAWQIHEATSEKKGKIEKKVKKILGHDWPLIDQILEIIKDFQEAVCGVEKCRFI